MVNFVANRRQVLTALAGAVLPSAFLSGVATAETLSRPADASLIAAAQAEGEVSFCAISTIHALQADASAFQAAYNIPATFLQIASGPQVVRIDQEIRAGQIESDVLICPEPSAIKRWIDGGQLAKLPDVNYPDKTDYTALCQIVYHGLLYNTKEIKEDNIPSKFSDLLNPQFAGRVALGSPRIGPGFCLPYYALLKSPKYGMDYFKKLAEQKPRVIESITLLSQSIVSGEAVVGFSGHPYEPLNMKAQNPDAPIAFKYLDIATRAPSWILINAKARHPKAAELFARWMMSPAGQQVHNENRYSSALGKLPGTFDPPTISIDPVTTDIVRANYNEILSLFDSLFS